MHRINRVVCWGMLHRAQWAYVLVETEPPGAQAPRRHPPPPRNGGMLAHRGHDVPLA